MPLYQDISGISEVSRVEHSYSINPFNPFSQQIRPDRDLGNGYSVLESS